MATINNNELSYYKNNIIKSGLFMLDEKDKPIGIFKLTNPDKRPYTSKVKTVEEIDDLCCRAMINKLARAIVEYKQNPLKPIDWVEEIKGHFETDFIQLLSNYSIDRKQLEPRYAHFVSKVNSNIRNLNQSLNIKPLTEKQRKFYGLVKPLYTYLDKYLRSPIEKKLKVSRTDIFHYIAHLLIACGLEEKDPHRGHRQVYCYCNSCLPIRLFTNYLPVGTFFNVL